MGRLSQEEKLKHAIEYLNEVVNINIPGAVITYSIQFTGQRKPKPKKAKSEKTKEPEREGYCSKHGVEWGRTSLKECPRCKLTREGLLSGKN